MDHRDFIEYFSDEFHEISLVQNCNSTDYRHSKTDLSRSKGKYIFIILSAHSLYRTESDRRSKRKYEKYDYVTRERKLLRYIRSIDLSMFFWLFEKENDCQNVQKNNNCAGKDRSAYPSIVSKECTESRPDQESETEHRSHETHIFRTIFSRGYIADIRLDYSESCSSETTDPPRCEK